MVFNANFNNIQLYRACQFQWWRERENIWGKVTKPVPSGSKDKLTNPDI
jgi:hypothetical protein